MKKFVSIFIVVVALLSGCDDTSVNSSRESLESSSSSYLSLSSSSFVNQSSSSLISSSSLEVSSSSGVEISSSSIVDNDSLSLFGFWYKHTEASSEKVYYEVIEITENAYKEYDTFAFATTAVIPVEDQVYYEAKYTLKDSLPIEVRGDSLIIEGKGAYEYSIYNGTLTLEQAMDSTILFDQYHTTIEDARANPLLVFWID